MTELQDSTTRAHLYRQLMQLAVHAQELRARCRRLRRSLVHLSAQRRPQVERELHEVQGELARVDTAIANVKAALALGAA
ncbi:MAG TPA: hypothetical protein VFO83_14930 [Aggregicoccus sp.]|nr:hypothetical protein [Aggregicoccus sp.]